MSAETRRIGSNSEGRMFLPKGKNFLFGRACRDGSRGAYIEKWRNRTLQSRLNGAKAKVKGGLRSPITGLGK
mgnify:CR=1 FL=1